MSRLIQAVLLLLATGCSQILPSSNNAVAGPADPSRAPGRLKAFPSAYGAGAYVTTGGRGGRVVAVTRLDDARDVANEPVPGTLRYALSRQEPRTVVFRVSGTIVIGDTDGDGVADGSKMLALEGSTTRDYSHLTVAGQTAPAGGITIKGHIYLDQVQNMIWRYVRVRHEVEFSKFDAITINNTRHVVLDHLSVSYGSDEGTSVSNNRGAHYPSDGISIQYCLFAENKTGHILGAINPVIMGGEMSYHNNFTANTTHRFPNTAADGRYEVINNLVYNWKFRLLNVVNSPRLNHINNHYKVGGAIRSHYGTTGEYGRVLHKMNLSVTSTASIYTAGNYITGFLTDPEADNWRSWSIFITANGYSEDDPVPKTLQSKAPHPMLGAAIPLLTAQAISQDLPQNVGAFRTLDEGGAVVIYRDAVDEKHIDAYQDDTGGTFSYASEPFVYPTIPSNAPYADTDADGMPDAWESANGFDPGLDDSAADADHDGYTNLEEFLNLVDR
jgi:hypothetical protein